MTPSEHARQWSHRLDALSKEVLHPKDGTLTDWESGYGTGLHKAAYLIQIWAEEDAL